MEARTSESSKCHFQVWTGKALSKFRHNLKIQDSPLTSCSTAASVLDCWCFAFPSAGSIRPGPSFVMTEIPACTAGARLGLRARYARQAQACPLFLTRGCIPYPPDSLLEPACHCLRFWSLISGSGRWNFAGTPGLHRYRCYRPRPFAMRLPCPHTTTRKLTTVAGLNKCASSYLEQSLVKIVRRHQ